VSVRLRRRHSRQAAASLAGVRWITRCAWCGRFRFAERWIEIRLSDAFAVKERDTHTICPECFAGLEDERRLDESLLASGG
jgi:hypothetical protein